MAEETCCFYFSLKTGAMIIGGLVCLNLIFSILTITTVMDKSASQSSSSSSTKLVRLRIRPQLIKSSRWLIVHAKDSYQSKTWSVHSVTKKQSLTPKFSSSLMISSCPSPLQSGKDSTCPFPRYSRSSRQARMS